jgi:hypothetical protein
MIIIINYLSLIISLILFEYFRESGAWDLLSVSAISGSMLVFIISFYYAYGKSGAWKQAHRPFSRLDEREAGIAYESLRIAYAVFSVIILIALLVYAIGGFTVSMIVFAGFLLLAHLIPASILFWSK